MTEEVEFFCPILCRCPQWLEICIDRGCQHPDAIELRGEKVKPRVRVKAATLMLGGGVPEDARAGDLVIGNRGAAALCIQPESQFGGLAGVLILQYVGNYYDGARPMPGGRMHDFRGGT